MRTLPLLLAGLLPQIYRAVLAFLLSLCIGLLLITYLPAMSMPH